MSIPSLQALAAKTLIESSKGDWAETLEQIPPILRDDFIEVKTVAEERAERPIREAVKVIKAAVSSSDWPSFHDGNYPVKGFQIECYEKDSSESEVYEFVRKVESILNRATQYNAISQVFISFVAQCDPGYFTIARNNQAYFSMTGDQVQAMGQKVIDNINKGRRNPDYLKYLKEIFPASEEQEK